MRHETYVTYEQAVKLKELGFDWECQAYYSKDSAPKGQALFQVGAHCANRNLRDDLVSTPTMTMAQKWLRDTEGVLVWVYPEREPLGEGLTGSELTDKWLWEIDGAEVRRNKRAYCTYEAALSAGIEKALNLLKNTQSTFARAENE